MNNIKISPSILSGKFESLGESVKDATCWGADYIHCDVMDGRFVPNITFGMPMVKALRKCTDLPLDVHLMIVEPEKYVPEFIDSGADIVTFHPDACKDSGKLLDYIRSRGIKGGLVVNPDVPVSVVYPYMDKLDMVVIMGVFPGFGGQKFIESTLPKMRELRDYADKNGYEIEIEVDGGVTEENAKIMIENGVNVLVGGSSVFKSSDPTSTIKILRDDI